MAVARLGIHRDYFDDAAAQIPAGGDLHDAGVSGIPLQHGCTRDHGRPNGSDLRGGDVAGGSLFRRRDAACDHRHGANQGGVVDWFDRRGLFYGRRLEGNRVG